MPLPSLILIHGYPLNHRMWESVIAAFDNKIRVIAPDLPGFGDNPAASGEPSIDRMADDIAELCKLHQIERAVVAGMSMGGYVALAFAERHPNLLAGLALISTQSGADTDEAKNARRSLIQQVQTEGPAAAAAAIYPKLFADTDGNPKRKQYLESSATAAGVAGVTWALEAMARRPDRQAVLMSSKVPILVLHGAADKIIPAERARKMAESNPSAKYVEIPSAGHATPMEAPREVADALLALLERCQ